MTKTLTQGNPAKLIFFFAMATYAAQNYGAGKFNRIRKGVFQCILISGSFSILMGFVNIFAGSQLTSLFVGAKETEVLALSQTYLTINGYMYPVLALLFIYRFTLQGIGKSLFPTVAGVMELIMRAIGALILTGLFGFAGTKKQYLNDSAKKAANEKIRIKISAPPEPYPDNW